MPPLSGDAALDDLPDLTPEEFEEPGLPSAGDRHRRSIVDSEELAERISEGLDDIPDLSPDEFAGPSRSPASAAPDSGGSPAGVSEPPAAQRMPPVVSEPGSVPPASAERPTPPPAAPAPVGAPSSAEPGASTGPAEIGGVALESVHGLQDLPEEAQSELAKSASVTVLSQDEEVGAFGAALITKGRVGIMSAIADAAAGFAGPGDIVFTRGTLEEGTALRVVALEDGTEVASWSPEELDAKMSESPWVADELRHVADRFQALAGATLGPLGDSVDDSLRSAVLEKLEVKALAAGEVIVESGSPIPGLHVVGAGGVELVEGGAVVEELGPGDFLFASQVLSGGSAARTARAAESGALLLFASRATAQELALGVPPLIEILAG